MDKIVAGAMLLALAGCAAPQAAMPELRLSGQSGQQLAPGSMLQRGRAQLGAGLDSMAIESFRAELRTDPDSADAFNGLAVAYGRIGRDDLAQRYFEMALAKAPDDQRYQNNLARLLEQAGKAELAGNQPAAGTMNAAKPEIAVATKLPALPAIAQVLDAMPGYQPAVIETHDTSMRPLRTTLPVEMALSKSGILSTQFAVLPVRTAVRPQAAAAALPPADRSPTPVPGSPYRDVPFGDLPREPRGSGARLERVSLGEVRLVTSDHTTAAPAKDDKFALFGDRLSVWLPQAVASEQANRVMLPGDKPAMLAAIERAEIELALADFASPEPVEFAYVFFPEDIAEA